MPSKTDAARADKRPEPAAIDDYLLGDEFFGDPFGSDHELETKKPKEPAGLGIDEEVAVTKRARAPRVKLDETRLLSANGIPKLRKRAADLKLKGKGHEFGDAARLLSFYQLWLDDLFPKAKFLDALAMVEKAGHKTSMHKARMDWINEGKPKPYRETPEPDERLEEPREPTRIAPIFEKRSGGAGATVVVDDDDDLFGGDIPNDVLDRDPAPVSRSIFGGGGSGEPDDDDLDALMAEAEADVARSAEPAVGAPGTSLFGPGKPIIATRTAEADMDELDAMMAENEADEVRRRDITKTTRIAPKVTVLVDDGEDDLDALMAEAEAEAAPAPSKPQIQQIARPAPTPDMFAEEEAAMAEMDDLW